MTAPESEVPTLSLPRSELLAYAMAARMVATTLRSTRESNGRAAWSDDMHGARIELAADAAAIDRLTPEQASQWNRIVGDGDAISVRHDPAGMVVSYADLPDGAQVVQAVLGDRVVTVAAGSADTGRQVQDWLAASPTHDRLTDLRAVADDIAAERTQEAQAAAADKTPIDDIPRTTNTGVDDENVAVEAPHALADKLTGRVPDRIFDDPRWGMAEKKFADYVAAGADPDELADAVAGLQFSEKVRTPAGLVAWQMRRSMKGHHEPATEDQARREAAIEWLATEASDGPDDRARAARLIGQFDDSFDAQLAAKYPGLLNAADGQFHDHNERSGSEHDLSAGHRDTAGRVDDDQLAIITAPAADGVMELPNVDDRENSTELGMASDHDHTAADEEHLAEHAQSDRAELAAHAAAAPLAGVATVGAGRGRGKVTPRSGRAPQQSKTQTRARVR